MAVTVKTLEVTWHFAEIDDSTDEVVKTRKISFSVPSSATAAGFTSRFETFKQSYLSNYSLENSAGASVGSLLQAANWTDDDFERDGSNVEYKCVDLTAELIEKTSTEIG